MSDPEINPKIEIAIVITPLLNGKLVYIALG